MRHIVESAILKGMQQTDETHGMPASDVSAAAAGLVFVSDAMPGIRRVKKGKTFVYSTAGGKAVPVKEKKRITALVLPPAWTDVWICPNPRGHLQATGRDARGRKQYRYHPAWRTVRDGVKYHRMVPFGNALPHIRTRVEADLLRPHHDRRAILATVVRLLDMTSLRVGNEEYAEQNHSYGLTTLHDNHVLVHGCDIEFHFRGKEGVRQRVHIHSRKMAKVIRSCQEMPGQELFQYVDQHGKQHNVTSSDVNDYIRDIAHDEFTAKDFRTWAGTVEAALMLQTCDDARSLSQRKKNIVRAVCAAAAKLGNTPAICRKCYVHPRVIEGYQKREFVKPMKKYHDQFQKKRPVGLTLGEAAVLAFLEESFRQ